MMKYAEILVHHRYVNLDYGARAYYFYEWKGSKNAPALADWWYYDNHTPMPWPLKIISTDYARRQYTVIRTDANPLVRCYYTLKEKAQRFTLPILYKLQRTAIIWGLKKDDHSY
jgi:hypothetical protein